MDLKLGMQPEKSRKSKWVMVSIVIVLAIFVGGIIWYAYSASDNENGDVSSKDTTTTETCAQESADICEGFMDGTKVKSCDCNTCTCEGGIAACTELGCPKN